MKYKSFFIVLFFSWPLYAATSVEKTDELIKQLAVEVSKTQNQIFIENKMERKIKGAMFSLEGKIKKASGRRASLKKELYAVKNDIRNLNRKTKSSKNLLKKQRLYLAKRLKAIYKLSDTGIMQVLFSKDLNLDKNLKYMGIIVDQDYDVIQQYKLNLAALKHQKDKLDERQNELLNLQKRYKVEEKKLEQDQNSQTKILKAIKKAQINKLEKIKALRKKLKKGELSHIDDEIEQLLQKTFFELKGKLKPPVLGKTILGYGLHNDIEFANSIRIKGDLLKVSSQASVLAVHSGVVQFVGPLPGYGNIIILDHGQSYYTVYGSVVDVEVKAGDLIQAHQQIAKTGSINHNNEKGVYFEIRHFSDPIDPKQWLATN